MSTSTDTLIIGAGPYGLSLSAHLTAAEIDNEIIGTPMQAWREFMPPGMFLRSEAFASDLYAPHAGYTFKDFCRIKGHAYQPVGMYVPLKTFVDYGMWFQSQLVKHLREAEIGNVRRAQSYYHITLNDGTTLTARRVVLALGLKAFESTPELFQNLPDTHVSHSSKFGGLDWSRDKDVVIVGGGQSALGLAALLSEAGAQTHVLSRDKSVTWNKKPESARSFFSKVREPEAGLGPGWRSYILSNFPNLFYRFSYKRRKRIIETSWGPSGAWWLYDRVVNKIDVRTNIEVVKAEIENGRVNLQLNSDGHTSSLITDHVIAATGFRTSIKNHTFLSADILDNLSLINGEPKLSAHFETSVSDFYIIGPATALSFGPVMRFVYGAKYATPHLCRHIRKRARSQKS